MKTTFKHLLLSTGNRVRLMGSALCLLLAAATLTQAQPQARSKSGVVSPRPSDSLKSNIVQKHDLEVKFFSGTLIGTNYQVGGTIKNVGQAAYSGQRTLVLYVRTTDYKQWSYTNKQIAIPALKPGQEWRIPTFYLPVKNMPTNRFMAVIQTSPNAQAKDRDANPSNDSRVTDATEVR